MMHLAYTQRYVLHGSLYGRTEQRALLPSCDKSLFFHDWFDHLHGCICEFRPLGVVAHVCKTNPTFNDRLPPPNTRSSP